MPTAKMSALRLVLSLALLLAAGPRTSDAAKVNTRVQSKTGASSSWWSFSSWWGGSDSPSLEVADVLPGEGSMQDEAVALPPAPTDALPPAAGAKPKLVLAAMPPQPKLAARAGVVLPPAVERLRKATRMEKVMSLAAVLPPQADQKPLEEFDVAPDAAGSFPGKIASLKSEAVTREDGERIRKGDIEQVASRPAPVALASGQEISVAAASVQALNTPAQRMQEQCLGFAKWAKVAGVYGSELTKLWQTTCEPAVKAGGASEKFVAMCSSMPKAMAEFAGTKEWDPKRACDALVAHFKASGVGADPVLG